MGISTSCSRIGPGDQMKKSRLDHYLAQKGISSTREKAKREILSGWVRIDGETVRDPAKPVAGTEDITVERPGGLFVSRGGEKLNHAIDYFNISMKGRIAADLGASTGGFTDCMLKRGAALIYAIDVGYGQLDYALRTDKRVVVMERTNVRNLDSGQFAEAVDFVTADLSFISITKVFGTVKRIFSPVEGIILIKPQFESQPGESKKGVVRNVAAHRKILVRVVEDLARQGMILKGLTHSPLKGPKGNIEFLLYFELANEPARGRIVVDWISLVDDVVTRAHEALHAG